MSSFDHRYRGLGQAANLIGAFGADTLVNLLTREAREESEADKHHRGKRQKLTADSKLEHSPPHIEDIELPES